MGSFDTVTFHCPKCDEKLETQSKAGSCNYCNFHHNHIPADVAMDIKGTKLSCPICDTCFKITGEIPRVSLILTPNYDEASYD